MSPDRGTCGVEGEGEGEGGSELGFFQILLLQGAVRRAMREVPADEGQGEQGSCKRGGAWWKGGVHRAFIVADGGLCGCGDGEGRLDLVFKAVQGGGLDHKVPAGPLGRFGLHPSVALLAVGREDNVGLLASKRVAPPLDNR